MVKLYTNFYGILKQFGLSCLLLLFFCSNLYSITALSQSNKLTPEINEINFRIPSVTKDGQKISTTRISDTKFEFNGGPLTLDDGIRFSWTGVDIDLKYKELPAQFGGWLRIYINDDVNEDNFIMDFGTYPADSVGLKISDLSHKLKEGRNTIMFVFVGYDNLKTVVRARVQFSFDFENTSRDPIINIIKPQSGAVIAANVHQEFEIELTNFALENVLNGLPNRGKLNIYYNDITSSTLLATISTSLEQGGKNRVVFNTKDFESFSSIPDSMNTRIIFVLTKTNGELLPFRKTINVITNFNNTLDIGFPRVTIIEPNRDRESMHVTGEQKFILQIDNFEISPRELSPRENQNGKGYLQIILNNRPVELAFEKTEFTLNELGASRFGEGTINVKVQLVNFDFTKLNPEASDSIQVFFIPREIGDENAVSQVQNNTWRFVIIGLIILLVVGSMVILITRG